MVLRATMDLKDIINIRAIPQLIIFVGFGGENFTFL